jgi:hypothetical protein
MWYVKAVRPHLECDFTPDGERKESMERIERDWLIRFATSGYTKHIKERKMTNMMQ